MPAYPASHSTGEFISVYIELKDSQAGCLALGAFQFRGQFIVPARIVSRGSELLPPAFRRWRMSQAPRGLRKDPAGGRIALDAGYFAAGCPDFCCRAAMAVRALACKSGVSLWI